MKDREEAVGPHGGIEPAHGTASHPTREDRVLDGPASGEKGPKGPGGRPEAESEEGPERPPEGDSEDLEGDALAEARRRRALGALASAAPVGSVAGDWEA